MKTGGHNRKSTAAHRAQGTYNATRHGKPTVEAVQLPELPPPPGDFDREHADKWSEVCGLLHGSGILAKQDLDSIKTYCQAVVMGNRAWARFQESGGMVDESKGRVSAWFLAWERADKIAKPLREQFGFTPRARQTLDTTPAEEGDDPIMAILNGN